MATKNKNFKGNEEVTLSQKEIERAEELRRKDVLSAEERLELAKLLERAESHRDSTTVDPVSGRMVEEAQDEEDARENPDRVTGAE